MKGGQYMENPLFDDVGQELKLIAEAKARMIMIAYALLGIVFLCAGIAAFAEDSPWIGFAGVVAAGLSCVYGYHKAHVEVILLYAYGELVHRVTSLEENLLGKNSISKRKTKRVKVAIEGEDQESASTPPVAKKSKNGTWNCPFCDHKNPAGADWCESCGFQVEIE